MIRTTLRYAILMMSIFALVRCGGGAQPETVTVVETVVIQAGEQTGAAYQQAVEVGHTIVGVVNEQVIEPYIVENPLLPDTVGVGFTPKYVPIRLAVDSDGNVLISTSHTIVTDVGAFDIETSKTVIAGESEPLLIIQLDNRVAVYRLPRPDSNEFFEVDFSDTYAHYRVMSFRQERNGNIVLKLEMLEYKE